jgi:hypothetical protein
MGVPVGTPVYVEAVLGAKAGKCVSKIQLLKVKLRSSSSQALWVALYYCCQCLLHHWLQMCPPDATAAAAATFDAALLDVFQAAVPAAEGHCHGIMLRRFRQPSKHFGAGLRSCVDVRHAAFIGACEQAVPRLLNRVGPSGMAAVGFSPLCEPAIGAGSFDSANEDARYRHLMSVGGTHGVSLGRHLAGSWRHLRHEAGITADDDPESSLLAGPAHLLGGGRPQLQKLLTKQVERHRHEVLLRDFSDLDIDDVRRWSYDSVGRTSMQWVHSWIGQGQECTNAE